VEVPQEDVTARIAGKSERVHILTGPVCNNNCIFCMEEDREGRIVTNSATTDETVQWILREKKGAEEICFTSGEPTVNPRLGEWVRWSRQAGFPKVSMMTNGRRLSYANYTRALVKAGMNRFYVSIHGHDAKLHEGLTRTPGSYEQTAQGIREVAALKRYGVELHTSTVITKRNLPHLEDIYFFLRGLGVDQVVFNVMQANGRANTYFDKIFPTYSEIASQMTAFLASAKTKERQVMAFLVDIPLCTTEHVDDFNRGYVESYVHFEPPVGVGHDMALQGEQVSGPNEGGLVALRRSDLDDAQREKRPECRTCKYDSACEGVWRNYLRRYGWDEFVPVRAARDA
jgi:cyclic pyranopterin phosphate synthase